MIYSLREILKAVVFLPLYKLYFFKKAKVMLLGLFQYLVVISMPVCESTAQGKIIGLIVL